VVKHLACTEESRVQFTAGPLFSKWIIKVKKMKKYEIEIMPTTCLVESLVSAQRLSSIYVRGKNYFLIENGEFENSKAMEFKNKLLQTIINNDIPFEPTFGCIYID
jgi:hypothetical protein